MLPIVGAATRSSRRSIWGLAQLGAQLGLRELAGPAYKRNRKASLPPFDHKPRPYTGPSAEEVLAMRKANLSPCECPHSSPSSNSRYLTNPQ